MSLFLVAAAVISTLAASVFFTRRFCDPRSVGYIPDHPNGRSLHDRPIPRGGGLAILIGMAVGGVVTGLAQSFHGFESIIAGMLAVGTVSFLDDRYSVNPAYRLIAHAAAAVALIYGGFCIPRLELPGISWSISYETGVFFSALFIIWMINLYNFMDGMDGFAGGMAIFGFGTFAAMAWMAHDDSFLIANLIVVSACSGFLAFNFPPARIFMGDVGSSTLGLMAAAFSLWGVKDNVFPMWIPLLVFSPFIMDASVTLFRRLMQGEKVWQAHKSHYYQKLVQAGLGHRATVLIEYIVMFACGATALWAMSAPTKMQVMILIGWLVFYFLFFRYSARIAKRAETATL